MRRTSGLPRAGSGDVVVTGDIPLAARCIEGGARVMKHDGVELTRAAKIGKVLATRDLMPDLRRADPFRQGGGDRFPKPIGRGFWKLWTGF